MLKIAALMLQEEIDNAPPKPRRRIERFRTGSPQLSIPVPSLVPRHLTPMGLSYDPRQLARNPGSLLAVEHMDFNLEILGK
jgi:hypothetical protein